MAFFGEQPAAYTRHYNGGVRPLAAKRTQERETTDDRDCFAVGVLH